MTGLYCPGCGRRCGTARRGDEYNDKLDSRDVVVERWYDLAGVDDGERQWRDGRRDLAGDLADLDRPGEWPMVWRCHECGAPVGLGWDRAERVGRVKRIILASIASDT